jgi:hypothetical protein
MKSTARSSAIRNLHTHFQCSSRKSATVSRRPLRVWQSKEQENARYWLVQLAGALGSRLEIGAARTDSLPHRTIAQYIGTTSRETVSSETNRLRRLRVAHRFYASAMRALG